MTRLLAIVALLIVGCGGDREVDDGRADVGGIVFKGERTKPVSGATVAVPGQRATTSSGGRYRLRLDRDEVVTLEAKKAGLLGALISVVPPRGGLSDVDLALLDRTYVDEKLRQAGLPARDTTRGLVIIAFEGATGGEGARLGAASDGTLTVLKETDVGVRSSTTISGGVGALVFANVAPGSTTVTLQAQGCKLRFPTVTSYPVRAGAATKVDARCQWPPR